MDLLSFIIIPFFHSLQPGVIYRDYKHRLQTEVITIIKERIILRKPFKLEALRTIVKLKKFFILLNIYLFYCFFLIITYLIFICILFYIFFNVSFVVFTIIFRLFKKNFYLWIKKYTLFNLINRIWD